MLSELFFFFFSIFSSFSNCTSLHSKERQALSCPCPLPFGAEFHCFSWYFGDSGAKSTRAESSLWQPFHTSVAQVPTKPVWYLCLLSKNGWQYCHTAQHQPTTRPENNELSAFLICRSDSLIHPFLPTTSLPYTFSSNLLVRSTYTVTSSPLLFQPAPKQSQVLLLLAFLLPSL